MNILLDDNLSNNSGYKSLTQNNNLYNSNLNNNEVTPPMNINKTYNSQNSNSGKVIKIDSKKCRSAQKPNFMKNNSSVQLKGKNNNSSLYINNNNSNFLNSKLHNVNNSSSFRTSNRYYDYLEDKDQRLKIGESKIVRRVNKNEYDNTIAYGKPSNMYANEHFSISDAYYNDDKQNNRTFRKLVFNQTQNQSIDLYSCENCKEIYRLIIENKKELKPMKCIQCGNIMNEKTYQFYYKMFRNNITNNTNNCNTRYGGVDDGKINENWKKWNDMRATQNKENLAYDIISGKAKIDLSKSNDKVLQEMVQSTRQKINKCSKNK